MTTATVEPTYRPLEGATPAVCGVCGDYRMVTTHEHARRFVIGASHVSHVYPCPACGQFVLDADGKKYGSNGRRYGNPLLVTDDDYQAWLGRNRAKAPGWQQAPLFTSEEPKARRLSGLYPQAPGEFVRWWVLGERHVYHELPPGEED